MKNKQICKIDRFTYKSLFEIHSSKMPIEFRNGLMDNIIFSNNGHIMSFMFIVVDIGNEKVGYDRFENILMVFPQYDKEDIDQDVSKIDGVFILSSGQQYDNNTLINTIIQQIKILYILSSDQITSLSKKLDDIYGQEEI